MAGEGTPFGNKIQLYCEHGYLLRISESGSVSGTDDNTDPYTRLELTSGNDIGTVRIKGIESELYVCFDNRGKLHGQDNAELPETIFREQLCGSYNAYESTCYAGWLLGISKIGDAKNGKRTQPGKKSTKFLPIRIE